MTEASYTAWDDKQYVWPPPDGWYEASDGKWWPKGYGPPQVTESSKAAEQAEQVEEAEQTAAAADRQTDNGWRIDAYDDQTIGDERSFDVEATAVGSGLASGAGLEVDLGSATDAVAAGSAAVDEGSSGSGGSAVDAASGLRALADGALADAGADVDPSTVRDLADQDVTAGQHPSGQDSAGQDAGRFELADPGEADPGEAGQGEVGLDERSSDHTDLGLSEVGVTDADPDNGDGLDEELPSLQFGATSIDGEITDTIPVGPTGDVDDMPDVDDLPEADIDPATTTDTPADSESATEEAHQASIRAANEAYGTGLMPPMADRPDPVDEAHAPAGGSPDPADTLQPSDARSIDLDSPAFATADQATVTSGLRGSADQQAMLVSPEKGSSRGLLFAILGVIALVAAGAALFFAIGGDGDAEPVEEVVEATGPGSVNEPHPRATGVVVYYPDGGVEQRWIVEVLEPIEDVTSELGPADDGLAFAATRIRITNESGNDGASIGDLRFNLVDGSNAVVVRTENTCPAPADELDFTASVALESSIEGAVCWAIPAGDLADLKLGIESSKVQGRVHILLQ